MEVRPATAPELEAWDDLTVHPGGGHVLQSMAWARHRAASGWQPHHLVLDDGSAVLALERRWPLIGGSSVYLPRGPIPAGSAEAMATRLDAVTRWLRSIGADVVASDAEVPAATGYTGLVERLGFRPIEEIQPSRHRYSLALGRSADRETVFAGVAKSTRQRIRAAERDGTRIIRHDRSFDAAAGFEAPAEPLDTALDRFYDLLLQTGERRHFTFGPRASFLRWWRAAHDAGLLVLLEARDADDVPIAGLILYRHGGRLTTVHSADDATLRRSHPGALHLLRWRAIELAIHEGCAEMDLGGVDVAGARREPQPGDPTYGLAEHKRAFGATWLELSGAHELVLGPRRYAVGRALARAGRMIRR